MHRRCPYCQNPFTPCRYHPNQVVCSQPDCQRRRRTDYHRQKVKKDAVYAEIVRDSQKEWRRLHPDYQRQYQRRRASSSRCDSQKRDVRSRLQRLLESIKNNVALDLKHSAAEVWLICHGGAPAKNIFASAEIIVIEAFTQRNQATDL